MSFNSQLHSQHSTVSMTPICPWTLLQYLLVLFLLRFSTAVFSQFAVPTLPGFPGPLPFKLETGYIGVGEREQVQLFYYFIESEGNPNRDPLLFWLSGGPGCSAISALCYEIGPWSFDLAAFNGSFPSLITNPYSWTNVASVIFIDSPVGTGFSYSTTPQGYHSSDTEATQHNYMFLRKWLSSHPKFLKNWIYVAGDSYAGKIVPMVALALAEGNEAGLEPRMLLQGYIIGNAVTSLIEDSNERIPYAHRMALVSDEYFELAKRSCNGKYVNPDPDNLQCNDALRLVNECTNLINIGHILEPKCKSKSPKPNDFGIRDSLVEDDPTDLISLPQEKEWCRSMNYVSSNVWMNNETVQEALHIRKGSIPYWKRCNRSISYDYDVTYSLEYHRVLNEKGFQALAYSGDHDYTVPYMSTLKWIRKLNLTVEDEWRPWTVDGQVAGYTEKYKNNQAFITFATVKGAGHTAPEYKPKECLQMLKRWLSLYPL